MLIETAFAKVNLALHVRRRRGDGYHDIESLFAFVDEGDVLRGERRDDGRLTLSIDGPFAAGLDDGPDNLVLQAAQALTLSARPERSRGTYAPTSAQRPSTSRMDREVYPERLACQPAEGLGNSGRGAISLSMGADLYLTKNLPVASGIGGGSADAAAALRLLNRLWDCGLEDAALCAIGETLGSDIPACVISRSLRVEGRGEALAPLDLPGLSGMAILLVNPGIPLGTAPVFKAWDQHDRGPLDTSSLGGVMTEGRNDLESPARELVPEIGAVLDVLALQPGVLLARMSGSGATCFALFDQSCSAEAACNAIDRAYPDWWTLCGGVR